MELDAKIRHFLSKKPAESENSENLELDNLLTENGNNNKFRAKASVAVILFQQQNSINVLLTKRSETLRSHPGETAFPGGKQDPEDSQNSDLDPEVVCALREMNEEIGLAKNMVKKLDVPMCKQISKYGILVTPVVFELDKSVVETLPAPGVPFDESLVGGDFFKINSDEVDCLFHLPLDVFMRKSYLVHASWWEWEDELGMDFIKFNFTSRFLNCPVVSGLTMRF